MAGVSVIKIRSILTKYCSKCKKTKNISEFYKDNKNLKYGLRCYCKSCCRLQYINWKKDNPDRWKEIQRNWHKTDKGKKSRRENVYRKMHSDKRYKLKHSVSRLMWQYLRRRLLGKQRKSVFNILPYTLEDLMKHLESNFSPGMTWDNYGKNGWSIDHTKADSKFKYCSTDDIGFKNSWKLENLKPMWYIENCSKGAK